MSTHKKPEKGDPLQNKGNLDGRVLDAMRSLGWIIPTTEEEVERAESMLSKEVVELPKELIDPYQTLEAMYSECHPFDPDPEAMPVDAEVEENLARAAREGGVIRPEIEQRMRKDRQAAEKTIT